MSFIENTIEQLDIKDVLGSERFYIAIQLVVVWVNRIKYDPNQYFKLNTFLLVMEQFLALLLDLFINMLYC